MTEVGFDLEARSVWTDEQVDVMVTHPQAQVRRVLAQAHHVRPEQRDRLVDDPDDFVRRLLAEGPQPFRLWIEEPEPALTVRGYERLIERMPRAVDLIEGSPYVPHELRERLWPAGPGADPDREPLTRAAAETMVAAGRPYTRTQAAAHPELPADLVERLAADPDHGVRLAVSMRPELTEEQRAAIDYRVGPEDRIQPAEWARRTRDPEVQRRCAASAHIGLRRSVAMNRQLAVDLVAVLARDADFAVRLLLCESQAAVPAETVIATFLEARTMTKERLLQHPAIRRDSLAHLADDPDPRRRAFTVYDRAVPADVIERLSHDPEPVVRGWCAGDARLSPGRVLDLFDDPFSTGGAAANPRLAVTAMRKIIDDAASLHDEQPPKDMTVYLGNWSPDNLPTGD
ncbi:hypothetical protein [Dactylosporangium sp. NPDC050588]|uniref:hypothetical protein n=1 Tax=Dactylosporangium sp. NPDC050588 TaxID=3157211 RepID=UPI0033D8B06D